MVLGNELSRSAKYLLPSISIEWKSHPVFKYWTQRSKENFLLVQPQQELENRVGTNNLGKLVEEGTPGRVAQQPTVEEAGTQRDEMTCPRPYGLSPAIMHLP